MFQTSRNKGGSSAVFLSSSGPQGGIAKGSNKFALVAVVLAVAGFFAYQTFQKKDSEQPTQGAVGEAVQLNLWDQEEASNVVHLDKWIKEFEAKNPGVTITRQTFQNEELRTRFTTFATGGQAAEIVYGPNDIAGVFATAGLISPIDSFVDSTRFTQASLDAAKLNGQYMAVPVSYGNHLMLFYNKKMVQAAPQTTDELIAVAKKFSDPAKNQFGLVYNQVEPFWLAPMLGGFGGWPLKYDEQGKATVDLDSPEMVATLSFVKALKFQDQVIPAECDYDCAKGLFLEGKAPLTINGDWVVPEFVKGLGAENLGVAPLPVVSVTGKPMTPMVSGRYVFINSAMNDAKKQAVAKFLDHLTSKSVQIEVAQLMNRIPANKEALESAEVQALPDLKLLIEAAKNGRAMPAEAELRTAWDSMRPGLQKVMAGTLDPQDAARLMQQSALEQLASMKE